MFTCRLPDSRRYRVIAVIGRLLKTLPQLRFNDPCQLLAQFLGPDTLNYLHGFRFGGDIDGYAKGEL